MTDNKLTAEKIHAAADALAESGTRPTLAAVREHLGGGSFTTISSALKSWKAKEAEKHELAEVVVPDAVSERLDLLKADLWKVAQSEAERRLQADRAALKESQEAAAAEVAEAVEAVQTLEAEAIQSAQQITDLTAQVEELTAKLNQSHTEKAELDKRVAVLEAEKAVSADLKALIEQLSTNTTKAKGKGQ